MTHFCVSCGYVGTKERHKKPTNVDCPHAADLILPQRITTDPKPGWCCSTCGKKLDPGPDWTGGSLYCSYACADM